MRCSACCSAVRADERLGMDGSHERSEGSQKSHVWVPGRLGAQKLLARTQRLFGHNRCMLNRCPARAPTSVGSVDGVGGAPGGRTRRGCARLGS